MSKIVTAQIVWLIRVQGSIKVLYLGGGGGGGSVAMVRNHCSGYSSNCGGWFAQNFWVFDM